MSESRVHPVISRYSFAREVTRLRESRALSLSGTRSERTEKKGGGGHEKRSLLRRHLGRSGGNTVVRNDDFLEGERGRGYTARRNPAVTHGRIELFIVMAACSTASSLCVGVRGGRGDTRRASASAGFFFLLPLPVLFLAHLAPRPLHSPPSTSVSLQIQIPGILSLSLSRYCNTATRRNHYARSPSSRAVPPLPRSLSRPFCTYATGRPLPVYPAGCPTPTYMAARHNCIRQADPVHTPRPSPTPPPPTPPPPPPPPSRGPH